MYVSLAYILLFLTGESVYFDYALVRTESSACNFIHLIIGRIFFLQNSFWLDTFQTLSYHDLTPDPAPSCLVAGWVDTVGRQEYSWKPFLWDEQYFHSTWKWQQNTSLYPVNPKSVYSQLNLSKTSKDACSNSHATWHRGEYDREVSGEGDSVLTNYGERYLGFENLIKSYCDILWGLLQGSGRIIQGRGPNTETSFAAQ